MHVGKGTRYFLIFFIFMIGSIGKEKVEFTLGYEHFSREYATCGAYRIKENGEVYDLDVFYKKKKFLDKNIDLKIVWRSYYIKSLERIYDKIKDSVYLKNTRNVKKYDFDFLFQFILKPKNSNKLEFGAGLAFLKKSFKIYSLQNFYFIPFPSFYLKFNPLKNIYFLLHLSDSQNSGEFFFYGVSMGFSFKFFNIKAGIDKIFTDSQEFKSSLKIGSFKNFYLISNLKAPVNFDKKTKYIFNIGIGKVL